MKEFARKYRSVLIGKLEGLNLTKILSEEDFYYKQVLDSTLPLQHSSLLTQSLQKNGILLDVGFGAGFPLVPLAYSLPEIPCWGIEAKAKKVEAVKQIGETFNLENLHLCHGRLEEFFMDVPLTLTFKAVGKIGDCLKKIRTDKIVQAFFYKGPRFHHLEGLEGLPKGWTLIEESHFPLPGTEGRIFLGFENTGAMGKKSGKSRKFSEVAFNRES